MLSPPKPSDTIQPNLVCELLTYMRLATAHDVWPYHVGPGEGPKSHISLNYIYKVNFEIFIPNFVCVLTNRIYKTYGTEFIFCHLGHAPGMGLGVL